MSKFAKFMKANKAVKANEFYAPTNSLCDEKGNALEWEFKHVSSADNERIREACTKEVQVAGKPNMFRSKIDTSAYIRKLICASVVMPDLFDSELQDSYGVKTPDDLLLAMVDDAGEYSNLAAYVQKLNGFDTSFEDKVDEAKN